MKNINFRFEITAINFARAIKFYSDIFNVEFGKIIMKNYEVSFLLFLLIATSITGCSNDSTNNDSQKSTGDYWPTSIDNNWVYTQAGSETSIKITGVDEIDGIKYYKFNQLAIFGNAVERQAPTWIKKYKGDYYIKISERIIQGVTDKTTGYEFLFFKDYLDVNQTWEGTYNYTTSSNFLSQGFSRTEVTYTGEIL